MTATDCATCHGMGRNGYCAPRRCYCRHDDCPAFYFTHDAPNATKQPADTTTWKERDEPTWIDNL